MTAKVRSIGFRWPINFSRSVWTAINPGKYRRASFVIVDQSIVSASNFLTIFVFAKYMQTTNFGILMLAHTGLLLITNLQNALVTQPHNMLGVKLKGNDYVLLTRLLMAVQAGVGLLVALLLSLAGYAMMKMQSVETGIVLIGLGAVTLPWIMQEYIRRVFYTKSNSQSAALNDGISYGLQLVGAIAVVYFFPDVSPLVALLVLGGSSLIAFIFGLWQIRSDLIFAADDSQTKSAREVWLEVWNFGKWLVAQNLVVWISSNGHAWIVGALLGAEKVGLYRIATHLANIINPLRQAAYSYLPARGSAAYAGSGPRGLKKWVSRTTWILVLGIAPVCALLIAFPNQILSLAYGPHAVNAGLGIILALSTIAQFLITSKFPLDVAIMTTGNTRLIFYLNILPVVLLLTVGVALIYYFGIVGIPIAGIIMNTSLLITTYFTYRALMKAKA